MSRNPRTSIRATYDSRETGPRYHVTTTIDARPVGQFMERIQDPFVRKTLHIGWLDLLRGLLRRSLTVEVTVGADPDVVEDVLELDDNYLGFHNSTRRAAFDSHINESLGRMAADTEGGQ